MTGRTISICLAAVLYAASAAEPYYFGPPKARQAVTNRQFTGIPSLCVTPKGRLWATWYAGPTPGEDRNNYIVLATSTDSGETWKEVAVNDPDENGPNRCYDANLWVTPDRRLQWNWSERLPSFKFSEHGSEGDYVVVMYGDDPESETINWTPRRKIADGRERRREGNARSTRRPNHCFQVIDEPRVASKGARPHGRAGRRGERRE